MNWIKKTNPYKIPFVFSVALLCILLGYQNCVQLTQEKKTSSKKGNSFLVGDQEDMEWVTIYTQSSSGLVVENTMRDYAYPHALAGDSNLCHYRLEIESQNYSHVFEADGGMTLLWPNYTGSIFLTGGIELFNYLENITNGPLERTDIRFELDLTAMEDDVENEEIPLYTLARSTNLSNSSTYVFDDFLDRDPSTVITFKASCP